MDLPDPYAPPKGNICPPVDLENAPLASRWARMVGAWVDGMTLNVLSFGVRYFILERSTAASANPGTNLFGKLPATAITLALWVVLNARLLHSSGQTLGKVVAGTRVVRRDGGPVGIGFMLLRYLPSFGLLIALLILSQLFSPFAKLAAGIFAVVFHADLLLIFRPSHACLHDDIAGTKVVVSPSRLGREW